MAEERSTKARGLLARFVRDDAELVVPDLFFRECAIGVTVRARSAEFGAWSKPGTSLYSSAIPANGKAAPGSA